MSIVSCISSPPFFLVFQFFFQFLIIRNYVPLCDLNKTIINEKKFSKSTKIRVQVSCKCLISYTIHHGDSYKLVLKKLTSSGTVSFSVTLEDSDDDRLFTIVSPVFLSCWAIIWELFALYPVTSSIEIKNMHQIIWKNYTVSFNMQDLKFLWITIESISGNLEFTLTLTLTLIFKFHANRQVCLKHAHRHTPTANTWLWSLVIRVRKLKESGSI